MIGFMISRDRKTYAERCLIGLVKAGLDVVIIDHGSTYEPMLLWLLKMRAHGFPVAYMPNRHPRDLWNDYQPGASIIRQYVQPDERFVVTDCDVVPADDCPGDWLTTLGMLLDEHPAAVKAGLGLRIDDLPEHFAQRAQVQTWEAQFQPGHARWAQGHLRVSAVWADIDTTLALYRAPGPFRLGPAIRTSAPYEALHLPWYEDSANLPEEIRFYNDRAEHGHWRAPDGFTDTHNLGGTT